MGLNYAFALAGFDGCVSSVRYGRASDRPGYSPDLAVTQANHPRFVFCPSPRHALFSFVSRCSIPLASQITQNAWGEDHGVPGSGLNLRFKTDGLTPVPCRGSLTSHRPIKPSMAAGQVPNGWRKFLEVDLNQSHSRRYLP